MKRFCCALLFLLLDVVVSSMTDFHVHSHYSAGDLSPEDLVKQAAKYDVGVMAITDIDQLHDYTEAIEAGEKIGLTVIRGAEITVDFEFEFPSAGVEKMPTTLLAYFTNADPKSKLYEVLSDLRVKRLERNDMIVAELLEKHQIILDLSSVKPLSLLGRAKMAALLVEQGHATTKTEAFEKYLSDPEFDEKEWKLGLRSTIHLVHESGAVPVLAFPGNLNIPTEALKAELRFMLQEGVPLKGLECYNARYPDVTKSQEYRELADEFQLIVTGGSDFYQASEVIGYVGPDENANSWADTQATSLAKMKQLNDYSHILESSIWSILIHLISYGTVAVTIAYFISIFSTGQGSSSTLRRKIYSTMYDIAPLKWLFYAPIPAVLPKYSSIPMTNLGDNKNNASDQNKSQTTVSSTPASSANAKPKGGALLFAFYATGLLVSYLAWGYFQERIMTIAYGADEATGEPGEHFTNSEFLVLCNRVSAGFIALCIIKWKGPNENYAPPINYSLCSVSNVMSSWFQYEALKYVSFPMQVLSKTSKILFAMLMGKALNGQSYPWRDYGIAVLITIGLGVFKLGDAGSHGNDEEPSAANDAATESILFGIGVLMLIGYCISDSFTGQWQSKIFKTYKVNSYQMMLGVNMWSSLLASTMLCVYGKMIPAIGFVGSHPDALVHICLMSICSATGQLFIFKTIATFGPVAFATVMTSRQFFSIMLSMYSFGHPMSAKSSVGLVIVFIALGYKVYAKTKKK